MTLHASTLNTPVGPFTAVVDDAVLVAAGFDPDADALHRRLDPRRRALPLHRCGDLGSISDALDRYFAGEVGALDEIAVDQPGGGFRTAAWKAMRAVPAGETISYAELALRAGSPGAGQAAGSACSQNRIALIVPCHRIVTTGGGLGGYYFGLDTKRWLLAHERGEQPLG